MKKFLIDYRIIPFFLVIFALTAFLDKALAIGLFLLFLLFLFLFFLLWKIGIREKQLYVAIIIVTLIHLAVVLFIYYTAFNPFGGGADYEKYHSIGTEIAQRFTQGNFSLEGLRLNHYFPVVVGILYLFTMSEMLIGQLFSVWMAVITILFAYLLIREINGSKRSAFWVSLLVGIYPSYLFFGSLLLKDMLVVPFSVIGLWLVIKMMKEFSWKRFLIFFIIVSALINLRLYIGFALLLTLLVCWLLISGVVWKKRIIQGVIMTALLGFTLQFSGYGYYGITAVKHFLNPKTIISYREVLYESVKVDTEETTPVSPKEEDDLSGSGFSFKAKTSFENPVSFSIDYSKTFGDTLLGPMPWHIKYRRQLYSLIEIVPLYFFVIIIIYGVVRSIRNWGFLKTIKRYRQGIPLLVFSLLALGAIALFITNYGIIMRVRVPAFVSLLCLMPLGFIKRKDN